MSSEVFWHYTTDDYEKEYQEKQLTLLILFHTSEVTRSSLIPDLVKIIVQYCFTPSHLLGSRGTGCSGFGFTGRVGLFCPNVVWQAGDYSHKTTKFLNDLHNKTGELGRSQRKKLLKQGIVIKRR
jgi:hypothetical protein